MKIILSACLIASVISSNSHACNCNGHYDAMPDNGRLEREYLDSLYDGISGCVNTDLDRAVELYKLAEKTDPNFPKIYNYEDGSFFITDPTGVFSSKKIRQQYVDTLLSFQILEHESDVIFANDGAHVIPKCVKKKLGLKEELLNGAKTIATH